MTPAFAALVCAPLSPALAAAPYFMVAQGCAQTFDNCRPAEGQLVMQVQDNGHCRDWLINDALTGDVESVPLYKNRTIMLSDHSQKSEGDPVTSVLEG